MKCEICSISQEFANALPRKLRVSYEMPLPQPHVNNKIAEAREIVRRRKELNEFFSRSNYALSVTENLSTNLKKSKSN